MKKIRIHKAWFMLVGCCLLQGGSLGIVHNCRGIFYAPIISDLGFGMGAFSFYIFFFGLCSCISLPFMGKLFARFDSRLLLGSASIVFASTVIAMGFFHSLPAFYIAGALQGISGGFLLFFPAPLILGNWFKKKSGLAIGISAAFSGFIGAVFNPIGNAVIEAFGWRTGYWFIGGLSLLMLLPVSVFLLRLHPSDCGMSPYGNDSIEDMSKSVSDGVPASVAKKSIFFWILILSGMLAANTCGYFSHLSPLGTYAGYGSTLAAYLGTAAMIGNVLSKIVLGHVNDRWGLSTSLAAGTACTLIGFILLLFPPYWIRLIGSLLYGASMAMSAIMIAIAIKEIYGKVSYGDLLPYSSMVATLGTSLMSMVIGYLVDGFGSQNGYKISLLIGIIITLLMGILLSISVRGGNRLSRNYQIN